MEKPRSLRCISVLIAAVVMGGMMTNADASPIYDVSYAGSLTTRLDWSSDLGVDLVNTTGVVVGTGAPLSESAFATRDGRDISAEITQIAPFVLSGQYWAAQWTGAIEIPEPGLYGLGGRASVSGDWNFSIPGQTTAENNATVFYYAAMWNVTSPADIHPNIDMQFVASPPLSGVQTGSFTLGELYSFGFAGFPMALAFSAETQSLDQNAAGVMNFIYQIAFSTTPIDERVFAAPPTVPEPATLAMMVLGFGGALIRRRRARQR